MISTTQWLAIALIIPVALTLGYVVLRPQATTWSKTGKVYATALAGAAAVYLMYEWIGRYVAAWIREVIR